MIAYGRIGIVIVLPLVVRPDLMIFCKVFKPRLPFCSRIKGLLRREDFGSFCKVSAAVILRRSGIALQKNISARVLDAEEEIAPLSGEIGLPVFLCGLRVFIVTESAIIFGNGIVHSVCERIERVLPQLRAAVGINTGLHTCPDPERGQDGSQYHHDENDHGNKPHPELCHPRSHG